MQVVYRISTAQVPEIETQKLNRVAHLDLQS